jgi:hypothetical protein
VIGAGAPDAQVSTPFAWDELDEIDHDALTVNTVPTRVAETGDPWERLDAQPQSLAPLLEMYERDLASGMQDAPWPPVYPKMPGEPPRVAPSRARKAYPRRTKPSDGLLHGGHGHARSSRIVRVGANYVESRRRPTTRYWAPRGTRRSAGSTRRNGPSAFGKKNR